jgi:hypothetical protein
MYHKTTRHFVSKEDLGKACITCHKIYDLHPCSNSSKATLTAGNTTVTDGDGVLRRDITENHRDKNG